MLGDKDGQDALRKATPNKLHCPFLRRKADACESLPDGLDDEKFKEGNVCPHNAYVTHEAVFEARLQVVDTVDRLYRLVNSAEVGVLEMSTLDPITVSELLASKMELDRQQNEKTKRESERSRHESEAKRNQNGERIDQIAYFEEKFKATEVGGN